MRLSAGTGIESSVPSKLAAPVAAGPPPIWTLSSLVKPVPLIRSVVPTGPDGGWKPDTVSGTAAAGDAVASSPAAVSAPTANAARSRPRRTRPKPWKARSPPRMTHPRPLAGPHRSGRYSAPHPVHTPRGGACRVPPAQAPPRRVWNEWPHLRVSICETAVPTSETRPYPRMHEPHPADRRRRRRRHRPGGRRRGPEGARGGRSRPRRLPSTTTEYDLGARRWHAHRRDAARLGARGAARARRDPARRRRRPVACPAGVLERGLLLRLRFELDHHVNLRPVRLLPGCRHPARGGEARRHRHGRRPRGHRGAVRRLRRRPAPRHAARGRDRGEPEHAVRRRARRPRRVRPRAGAAAPDCSPWCTRTTC